MTNRAFLSHRHVSDGLRKPQRPEWPDCLSGARAVGEVEPVRVFESAEAAMSFLVGLVGKCLAYRRTRGEEAA